MGGRSKQTLNASVIIARPLRTDPGTVIPSLAGGWFDLCDGIKSSPVKLTKVAPPTLTGLVEHLSKARSTGDFVDVLHFSGTAFRNGLEFEDDSCKVDLITMSTLASSIKAGIGSGPPLKLCFFRARGSTDLADTISEAILRDGSAQSVLLDEGSLTDQDAMKFAAAVYRSLAAGLSLREAADLANNHGNARVRIFGEDKLQLHVKGSSNSKPVDARPPGEIEKRLVYLGRETVLLNLTRRLLNTNGLTVVSGISGIGKTALVTEVMHRMAWNYPGGVTAISMPQDKKLAERKSADPIIAEIMRDLALITSPESDLRATFLSYLNQNRTLIFIDNLDWLLGQFKRSTNKSRTTTAEAGSLLSFLSEASKVAHVVLATIEVETQLDKWLQGEGALRFPLVDGLEAEAGCRLVIERAIKSDVSSLQKPDAAMLLAKAARFHPELIRISVPRARSESLNLLISKLNEFTGSEVENLRRMIEGSFRKLPKFAAASAVALTLFPSGSCSIYEMQKAIDSDTGSTLRVLKAMELASLISYSERDQRYKWHASVFECARHLATKNFNIKFARNRLVDYYKETLSSRMLDSQSNDPELTNLLHLLESSSELSNLSAIASAVVSEIDPILHVLGRWVDSKRVVKHILSLCDKAEIKDVYSGLCDRLACAHQALGEFEQARDQYNRSLKFCPNSSGTLHGLGRLEHDLGNKDDAQDWYDKSLDAARHANDDRAIARVMHDSGRLAHMRGDIEVAREQLGNCLGLRESIIQQKRATERWDKWDFSATCHELGSLEQTLGNDEAAKDLYEKSLAIRKSPEQSDRRGKADTQHALGSIWQERKEFARANTLYSKSLLIKRGLLDQRGVAVTLVRMAEIIAEQQGDLSKARQLYDEACIIQQAQDPAGLCYSYNSMAKFLFELQGRSNEAISWFTKSSIISTEKGFSFSLAVAQLGIARNEDAVSQDLIRGLGLVRDALAFFESREMPQRHEALLVKEGLEVKLVQKLQAEFPIASLHDAKYLLPELARALTDSGESNTRDGGKQRSLTRYSPMKLSSQVREFLAHPVVVEIIKAVGRDELAIILKHFRA